MRAFLLISIVLIAACGQSGDLYLPPKQQPAEPTPGQPPPAEQSQPPPTQVEQEKAKEKK
jgi:predicted small lipoprotein YifL